MAGTKYSDSSTQELIDYGDEQYGAYRAVDYEMWVELQMRASSGDDVAAKEVDRFRGVEKVKGPQWVEGMPPGYAVGTPNPESTRSAELNATPSATPNATFTPTVTGDWRNADADRDAVRANGRPSVEEARAQQAWAQMSITGRL